jgi:hypothetical protein
MNRKISTNVAAFGLLSFVAYAQVLLKDVEHPAHSPHQVEAGLMTQ